MEQRFAEQQAVYLQLRMDQGFAQLRAEANTNPRWVIGFVLANIGLTAALYAKQFGLY